MMKDDERRRRKMKTFEENWWKQFLKWVFISMNHLLDTRRWQLPHPADTINRPQGVTCWELLRCPMICLPQNHIRKFNPEDRKKPPRREVILQLVNVIRTFLNVPVQCKSNMFSLCRYLLYQEWSLRWRQHIKRREIRLQVHIYKDR